MKKGWSFVALSLALVACVEESRVDEAAASVEVEDQEEEVVVSPDAWVIDFGADGEDRWYAVNDTVMGGVSDGDLSYSMSELRFEGSVSTESNGGFTSVRSPDETLDLRDYDSVVVRMRSEGQPFSMVLAHNDYWFEDQFRYDILEASDTWTEIEIPFRDFDLYTLDTGYPVPTGDRMKRRDRREILHLEFISELFEAGPFLLEVDYIAFQ
jgi:hypothetical protein